MTTEIRRKDPKNRVLKQYESVRKDGRYCFRYPIGNGKRRSIYADTLEELRKREKSVQKDIVDGINLNNDLSINELYERWVNIKRGLKETTFSNYKYMYEMFVAKDFGRRKITTVKKSDVRAFYNTLNEVRGLALGTIDSVHTVLHQVFDLAVEDEYIRSNPADKALLELKRSCKRGMRCKKEKPRALTVPEMKLFEDFINTDKRHEMFQPIFTVMLWTGMRVGEVTGLIWDDIDFEKKLIHVQRTLVYFDRGGTERCGYAINTTKTKAGDRYIPMLPQVIDAFIKQKALLELTDRKCEISVDGITDFVFLNRFGGPFNQSSLNRALGRIMKDCNFKQIDSGVKDPVMIPPLANHWLRHTFATRCVEAGMPVKALQSVLGHSDIETTLDIYTDASTDYTTKELAAAHVFFNNNDLSGGHSSAGKNEDDHSAVVRPIYAKSTDVCEDI